MSSFTLIGKWNQLKHAFDPVRFRARERAIVGAATVKNGVYVAGQMKRAIRSGGFTSNAALTTAIKGSTKSLFDRGGLIQSITHRPMNWRSVFVGVLKQARTKDGKALVDVVAALHDGATVKITPRMRSLFWYLWLVSTGKMSEGKLRGRAREIYERIGGKRIIKPLNAGATAIRIPGRPFMRQVFQDPKVIALCKRNWTVAIARALRPV